MKSPNIKARKEIKNKKDIKKDNSLNNIHKGFEVI